MELAKTYYSKAITLNPDNMRALYGLLMVFLEPKLLIASTLLTSAYYLPTDILAVGLFPEDVHPEEEGVHQIRGVGH